MGIINRKGIAMENRLKKGTLGGQAVIEGVMMKGKDSYSVAVRKPDQKIEVKLEQYKSVGDKYIFGKIPFIRGIVNFTESLVVGMKTLSYSSTFYEEEEEETKADKLFKDIFKEKAESVIIGITVLISVLIAIALFMMLPAALAEFIGKWVESRILLSLIEGVIRLIIFIIYVLLISQMEDIKRVFMYHGAEHKTINCYEAGEDLTPTNVAKYSRYHKRCGTSFLFIVMVVSIFVFMFITVDKMWLRFVLRLLLIPVIAGISYEFIRLAGRSDNVIINILSMPGMWIQKLTTKEPQEEMIQVAIISVESVLYGEQYVDAVNEAQGLGKFKPKEEPKLEVKEKVEEKLEEAIEEVSEYEEFEYEEVESSEEFEYEEVEATGDFEFEEVEAEEIEFEEVEESDFEEVEAETEELEDEETEENTDKLAEIEESEEEVNGKEEIDDEDTDEPVTEKLVAESEEAAIVTEEIVKSEDKEVTESEEKEDSEEKTED